jgi:hypothetical protein
MILPFFYILIAIPGKTLHIVPFPWRWLITAGRIMALLVLLLALRQTGFSQFFGLAQLQETNQTKKKSFGDGRVLLPSAKSSVLI